MAPSHVLVPLDGSPMADKALVHALETFDCEITVLNVVTPMDAGMSESGVLEVEEARRDSAADRAEKIVGRAKQRAEEMDRTVQQAVESGDPAETILSYVDEHEIDHVVMGGHGKDGSEIARRLLGTVATAVVSDAGVTVTVVR